jgi:hypothetical protein
MKGMIANTLSEGEFALLRATVPTPASIILAPKLAVAEKHINVFFLKYKKY